MKFRFPKQKKEPPTNGYRRLFAWWPVKTVCNTWVWLGRVRYIVPGGVDGNFFYRTYHL